MSLNAVMMAVMGCAAMLVTLALSRLLPLV